MVIDIQEYMIKDTLKRAERIAEKWRGSTKEIEALTLKRDAITLYLDYMAVKESRSVQWVSG